VNTFLLKKLSFLTSHKLFVVRCRTSQQ